MKFNSNIGSLLVRYCCSSIVGNLIFRKRHLKYWHFVGHLRLELHLLSVVELKQEVGGKAAVKALEMFS